VIERVIGPMSMGSLPEAKETEADYALVLEYVGDPDCFDPNEYAAAVFQRRFDFRINPDGYYWHRMNEPVSHSVGPFDTTLTQYPETITIGDHKFPVAGDFSTKGWRKIDAATAADLDTRDHFASEVRDLHPTQLDRIEKRLNEIERQLGIRGV
jgi:hypothetical protein